MDKFTKVRNIGKGNMGACALARNNEDGKYYVIKQVDLTRMNKKERQQSLNEARVLSSLRHPNIINYVDSFLARKSDHLCIVMEYADGGDLSSRIKKNYGVNFRETQILDWFIQAVLSLHYVHRRKILHRDVKTQNIFLTNDGQVKLGDFGIARTLCNTYDQAKTFVGTPYYLSPELILEKPYDHRSDVWAVGVVLYELLTLKHPFNASDMKGLMQRILKVQYDPIPIMYSSEIRNLVPMILVKDPSKRIRLADILELPIVNRRLVDWLNGDALPKKYVDALIAQNLLPESVIALAKAQKVSHTPNLPPVCPVDSSKFSESSSSDTVIKRKTLLPIHPIPAPQYIPAAEDDDFSGAQKSRSTSKTSIGSSTGNRSIEEETTASSKPSKLGKSVESSTTDTPKATAQAPHLKPEIKPLPSPALFKQFNAPNVLPISPRASGRYNSDFPGNRAGSPSNFYQVNYYQRFQNNNRDLYRNYGHGQYSGSNLPSLRRNINRSRMENGQAASHLNPLFNSNSDTKEKNSGPRQSEIRNILQRAAARRKMGT